MKLITTSIALAFLITTQTFGQNKAKITQLKINHIAPLQIPKSPVVLVNSSEETETPKRKCGSPKVNVAYEEALQAMVQKHEQFANGKKASVVYTIPIIFHIIHTGQAVGTSTTVPTRNLNAAFINSQLATLNADYRKMNSDFNTWATQSAFSSVGADIEINFCLARVSPTGTVLAEPGIHRVLASSVGLTGTAWATNYIESNVKPATSWDPTQYFNVWILEFGGTDLGTLGYAQFPTIPNGTTPVTDMVGMGGNANTDGVAIDWQYTGVNNDPYYNKGRTLTHESGHWLGLWHINGDASCGDDFVADTPQQNTLSGTCPTTAGATVASGCSAAPNPPGRMYQNYMDYSDDPCMVMFTAGQKARMQAVMANCVRRSSLNTSTVCTIPNGIHENNSNVEMSIFPNPTNGEINVTIDLLNTQDFTISVVNTLGQTIKEIKQLQSNGGSIKIDLSNQSTGVYFVTLKSKTISKSKRIILQ